MTTLSIHKRPDPIIAAAVAVAALAAGAFAWSVSDDSGHPSAPGGQSQVSVHQQAPRTPHFQGTTSGGHVMTGL